MQKFLFLRTRFSTTAFASHGVFTTSVRSYSRSFVTFNGIDETNIREREFRTFRSSDRNYRENDLCLTLLEI